MEGDEKVDVEGGSRRFDGDVDEGFGESSSEGRRSVIRRRGKLRRSSTGCDSVRIGTRG